jgi:hypothetical protein
MTPSIDISRLEKVRRTGNKITARCPACAASGGDRTGAHFYQNSTTGQFGCAAFPGDREHRREIFALVGIRQERDPAEQRAWARRQAKITAENFHRRKLTAAICEKRAAIISAHPWSESEARRESPEHRIGRLNDPRAFLAALFPPDAIVWTGEVYHSGSRHADRWRTVSEWQDAPAHTVGPMVSPAIWKPGTVSRAGSNVEAAPYVILDFDGFDNVKPTTPTELADHVAASLAIVRWLREALNWRLAAVLWTGGKSVHAWFHSPPPAALESLKNTAPALGIDAGLVGHPEHPARLPGWLHAKTGQPSRVLWLQRRDDP